MTRRTKLDPTNEEKDLKLGELGVFPLRYCVSLTERYNGLRNQWLLSDSLTRN